MRTGARALRRVVLETLGWLLIAGGIAALILPGPGLLMLVAGLALLSQQYEWAERRLQPVKKKALETAADGVATWPRIAASTFGALALVAVGVVWTLQLDAPTWWPLDDKWWLPGGWGTGLSITVSGLVALALIIYSYRNYRDIKAHDPTP